MGNAEPKFRVVPRSELVDEKPKKPSLLVLLVPTDFNEKLPEEVKEKYDYVIRWEVNDYDLPSAHGTAVGYLLSWIKVAWNVVAGRNTAVTLESCLKFRVVPPLLPSLLNTSVYTKKLRG